MLGPSTRIEAYDKVVTGVVGGVVFAEGFGEVENAPVCYSADYAAGVQDDVAGGFGDSVGGG